MIPVLLRAAVLAIGLSSGCVTNVRPEAAVAPDPAIEARARQIKVKTFTGDENGLLVNSHLITSSMDAVLVDAQFSLWNAEKLVQFIRDQKKDLKTILITHADPDHFAGLELLTRYFPRAKVVSTAGVVQEIKDHGRARLELWRKAFAVDTPERIVVPEALDPQKLEIQLEQEKFEVLAFDEPAESDHAALLYIPSRKALIAGDLVFKDVHPFLDHAKIENWLDRLDEVASWRPFLFVLPGHGEAGDPATVSFTRSYLESFLGFTLKPFSATEAIEKMQAAYPKLQLKRALQLSVERRAN